MPLKKEVSHLLPTFLPDGRHFVYLRVLRDHAGIWRRCTSEASIRSPREQSERKLLLYAPGLTYTPARDGSIGRLLFVREGTLMAQPFDERLLDVTGEAGPRRRAGGRLSRHGVFFRFEQWLLVYRTSDPAFPIAWFDRQGTRLARVSDPGSGREPGPLARRIPPCSPRGPTRATGPTRICGCSISCAERRPHSPHLGHVQLGLTGLVARREVVDSYRILRWSSAEYVLRKDA